MPAYNARHLFVCVVLAVASSSLHATPPEPPVSDGSARRIALAPFDATPGVDRALADALTDVLGVELDKFKGVDVVTPVEVRAALHREALHQLMSCEEPSCFGIAQRMIPA